MTRRNHGTGAAARLVATVKQSPGLTLSQLRERVEVGWGTLYHHIPHLERMRLIQVLKNGRHQRVYPTRNMLGADAALRANSVLRSFTARRIAEQIHAAPGRNVGEVAIALALSERVVYYHVKRLVEAQLVKASGAQRYDKLAPTHWLELALK